MACDCDKPHNDRHALDLSRRTLLHTVAASIAAAAFPRELLAELSNSAAIIPTERRFPYFKSTPVSYFDVRMEDNFWAPRQKVVREVSVPWATGHFDAAGGLASFKAHPQDYNAKIRSGDLEAIKFIEAMAAVAGLQRDASIEGLAQAWGRQMMASQEPGGYWTFGWPLASDPAKRWQAVWWSHEDYALGHYLESALAYRESTGDGAMYESAVRAVDNMAATFLGSDRAYAPGHQEIEQALMRLYGATGNTKYLQLCGWLIGQRGHRDGRLSYGKYSQDHLPINQQRTIEGHAVRAAFLFNGVTEYVGATGDAGLSEAMLAIWDNFVNHKMYLHGAGGNESANNEGYSIKPDFIPPNDCYGESCSIFGMFQWAHNLFRLTGKPEYLDAAERMLYNAFYASLSLQGDRYFYQNVAAREEPTVRFAWHPVPCCPPNIVKLFSKVGGFFYSMDRDGIFIKHYGASTADVPFGSGIRLIQRTEYPWSGAVAVHVEAKRPTDFTLRLRVPGWAKSYSLAVNGKALKLDATQGWLAVRRRWRAGDKIELELPMEVERVTMPERFKEYANLAAIQRGPIVYCLEEEDVAVPVSDVYVPQGTQFTAEHRPDFLGGVTVLRADLKRQPYFAGSEDSTVPAVFVPYGVWNNRVPGTMSIWLAGKQVSFDTVMPESPPGDAET